MFHDLLLSLCVLVLFLQYTATEKKLKKPDVFRNIEFSDSEYTLVDPKEYPYIVMLYYANAGLVYICGGSLVDTKWILTSAHCLPKNNYALRVIMGKTNVGKVRISLFNEASVEVDLQIKHEKYQTKPRRINDIAMVRLKHPVPAYLDIVPVKIETHQIRPRSHCKVVGWGFDNKNVVLKEVKVLTTGFRNCEESKYWLKSTYDMFIWIIKERKEKEKIRSRAVEDTGGLLICNKKFTGIASVYIKDIDTPCERFTKVDPFIPWVNDVKKNGHISTRSENIAKLYANTAYVINLSAKILFFSITIFVLL